MSYPRIHTIQDVSCVGQCSLTVALPIISACGIVTCILPSAVLSTHTAGFSGYTFRDLTDDMPAIRAHWEKENIAFGVVDSIVKKVATQAGRLHLAGTKVCLTGGLCDFEYVCSQLSAALKSEVLTYPDGRYAGAIGAALSAAGIKK